MQQTMQSDAAVFRTGSVLKEGVTKIEETYKELSDLKAILLCLLVWFTYFLSMS